MSEQDETKLTKTQMAALFKARKKRYKDRIKAQQDRRDALIELRSH